MNNPNLTILLPKKIERLPSLFVSHRVLKSVISNVNPLDVAWVGREALGQNIMCTPFMSNY